MPETRPLTLAKAERINSKKQVDRLFRGGGSRAMSAFPVRMVYATQERSEDCREPKVQMMVSVPKRHFKRAVKRNRLEARGVWRIRREAGLFALRPQRPAPQGGGGERRARGGVPHHRH